MNSLCQNNINRTSKTHTETALQSVDRGRAITFAIGTIVLLGSLAATGCLYHNLGCTSFAFAGSGLTVCTICLLSAYYFCTTKPAVSDSEKQAPAPTQLPPRDAAFPTVIFTKNEAKSLTTKETEEKSLQTEVSQSTDFQSKKTSGEIAPPIIGKEEISQINNLKFNRLPCKHEGNSCFVNTALQIIAHLADFRKLFDDSHYKLEKRLKETEDSFDKRQIVQKKGNQIINDILQGYRVEKLEDFIQAVNDALTAMGNSTHFNIHSGGEGGDPMVLLMYTELILYSRGSKNAFIIDLSSCVVNKPNKIKKMLKKDKRSFNRNSYSPILRFNNYGDFAYRPEIVIDGIGTYLLEAVALVNIYGIATSGLGHAKPVIHEGNRKYITLDDLTGRADEMSENDLSNILGSNQGWQSAYYIRVKD